MGEKEETVENYCGYTLKWRSQWKDTTQSMKQPLSVPNVTPLGLQTQQPGDNTQNQTLSPLLGWEFQCPFFCQCGWDRLNIGPLLARVAWSCGIMTFYPVWWHHCVYVGCVLTCPSPAWGCAKEKHWFVLNMLSLAVWKHSFIYFLKAYDSTLHCKGIHNP